MMLLATREGAWYIIFVLSLSLSVCMYVCQTTTFESLDVYEVNFRSSCTSLGNTG